MNIILFESNETTDFLSPSDPRGNHILRVLRSIPGDEIRCGFIGGVRFSARVVAINTTGISLRKIEGSEETPLPPVPLRVAIGHPRPLVLQRLFRDLSSFGIARISVFLGELSEKSYFRSSLWNNPRRFLIDGAMQGGVTSLPEIEVFRSTDELLRSMDVDERILVADIPEGCGDGNPVYTLTEIDKKIGQPPATRIAVVIGPERGFSSGERILWNRLPRLQLGETIMRTETAAVVAAASISQALRKRGLDEYSGG